MLTADQKRAIERITPEIATFLLEPAAALGKPEAQVLPAPVIAEAVQSNAHVRKAYSLGYVSIEYFKLGNVEGLRVTRILHWPVGKRLADPPTTTRYFRFKAE